LPVVLLLVPWWHVSPMLGRHVLRCPLLQKLLLLPLLPLLLLWKLALCRHHWCRRRQQHW
jgi:hypothetical protein